MRLAWMVLGCAGCLSTPPPSSVDDDAGPEIDAEPPDPCDRDVRPTTACVAELDLANNDFPGRPFSHRNSIVDDVNSDGVDDLVVVSNAAPPDAGVFVLLGPVSLADPGYHAFVQTDLQVGDIQLRALPGVGSACADLTVFGRSFDGTTGVVQVWPSVTAQQRLFAPAPIVADAGFVPDVPNGPTLLAWARLRELGDDLLLADLYEMRVVRAGGNATELDAAAVDLARHDPAPDPPAWQGINGIDPAAVGDCTRDQVLIAENTHAHVLLDDGPDPVGGADIPISGVTLNTELADLDGVPPLDVLIGGATGFGVYLRDGEGITTADGPTMYDPFQDSYRLDAFAVGELGGSAQPELVAIDNPDGAGTGTPRAVLISGLNVSGAVLQGDSPRVLNLPGGFVPRDVVIADLDDNGTIDAWLIGDDGSLLCYQRGTTVPQLEACP